MSACWMGSVPCASWTVAGVVWTWVRRCGAAGSQVSLTCTMEPVQDVSRLWREGAPPSKGGGDPFPARGELRVGFDRAPGAGGGAGGGIPAQDTSRVRG